MLAGVQRCTDDCGVCDRRRQVEDEVDPLVLDQVVDRELTQRVLGRERLRSGDVEIGAGNGPPPLERHRVPHVASADDPAADDADAQRGCVTRPAAANGVERSLDAAERLRPTLSSSTIEPLDAGAQRGGQHALVTDDAVADRNIVAAVAAAIVLHVHERTATARRLELGDWVASRLPDPSEVELEPEQLRVDLPQQVEKRGAIRRAAWPRSRGCGSRGEPRRRAPRAPRPRSGRRTGARVASQAGRSS